MDGLEFRVLGPVEVLRGGTGVPVSAARQRDVLVALALRAGTVVPADRLVRLLWGDEPPATARNTLQTLVSRLRRLLVDDVLQGRPAGYLLAVEPDRLDAHRFETGLRAGRAALTAGDPETAVRELEQALALWRGPALSDVASDELRLVEQPRLAELRQQAVEDRIEARLALGDLAAMVGELRALVAEHPLRERPYQQLMTALYRSGRRAEALETYRHLHSTLSEQLGIDPGPAVQQLHQAILRDDPALSAQQGAPDQARAVSGAPSSAAAWEPPAQLPAAARGFTGRAEQLGELDRLAEAGVVAVVGMAGVGKTALVLRWAQQARERFPGGQLYADLGGFSVAGPQRPVDVLGQFLRALGVPAGQVPVDEAEAAAAYRTRLADREVLVLLDNARDAGQVRPLLPAGPGCLAVVTSRDRLDSLMAYEGAVRLRLEPLPAAESRDLLAQALGSERLADEPAAVDELAWLCAHLPLALRIAAASLAGRRGGLAEYVAQLREYGLDGLTLAEDTPVRATFARSYAVLANDAQRLFRRSGCVPGLDLSGPAAAALAGTDSRTADRLLDQLAAAHLLTDAGGGRFTCHDLLRDYAVRLAGELPAAEREAAAAALGWWFVAAAEAAADLVRPDRTRLPVDPVDAPGVPRWERPAQAVAWLDVERHNLVRVAQHAAGHGPPEVAWRLAGCLPIVFAQRGHLAELAAVGQAARTAAGAAGDATGQAGAHLALGLARWARQQYDAAVEPYTQAARYAELAGWPDGQAAALVNLGSTYQGARRLAEAEAAYTRALARLEQLGDQPRQAVVLGNLGNLRVEAGDIEPALAHLTRAVALLRAGGGRTGLLGVALGNLGMALLDHGQPEHALPHLTEALSIHQEIGNQVSEATALTNVAVAHRDAGRLEPAAEVAGTALRLAQEIGQRVTEAAALSTLGTIYRATGMPQRALAGAREALELARRTGHAYLEAQIHLELAETYRDLGQHDLAGSHAAQALTIARTNGYQRLGQQASATLTA